MSKVLTIHGYNIEVTKKNIKNIYLRVSSSEKRISISAPKHINDYAIRLFILSKLNWIKQRSEKLQQQAYFTPQKYIDNETHYVWGKECSLSVVEKNAPASIALIQDTIQLTVRPGATVDTKKQLFGTWSRGQLRMYAHPLIEKWCPVLGVSINKLYVRKMKCCWGSCNTRAQTIRLNTELVKKPLECLEYVVVHELVHLLEPSHNRNFHRSITKFLPDWKDRTQLLNNFH